MRRMPFGSGKSGLNGSLEPWPHRRLSNQSGRSRFDACLRLVEDFSYGVLRVIFNQARTPPHVVTAFSDRAMKGKL